LIWWAEKPVSLPLLAVFVPAAAEFELWHFETAFFGPYLSKLNEYNSVIV